MEENESILLNSCKMHIGRIGRKMNIFSIISVISILFVVVFGLVMLALSSKLPEDTPYYLDNILGLAGVGIILVSAALIPAVVYMRRAVHTAKTIEVNNDLMPATEFLRDTHKFWKYTTTLLIILFIIGILGAAVAGLYYLSLSSNL